MFEECVIMVRKVLCNQVIIHSTFLHFTVRKDIGFLTNVGVEFVECSNTPKIS
jgi:hypothetical protein